MRKTEKTTIDGITFEVTQLNGMAGIRLFGRLSQRFGPSLDVLAPMLAKASGGLDKMDAGAVLPAVGQLLARLDETEMEYLTRTLLETATMTEAGGQTQMLLPAFDLLMAGRAPTALKLILFALKVNFGSFLGGQFGVAPSTPTASPSAA